MVSAFAFLIIEVSEDEKHWCQDDLLIICKSNQTSEHTVKDIEQRTALFVD